MYCYVISCIYGDARVAYADFAWLAAFTAATRSHSLSPPSQTGARATAIPCKGPS